VSALGTVHLVFALVALAAGAGVLRLPKGTRWHRTLGHLYLGGMVGLDVTALFIYRLTGGFGLFHAFALFSLFTVGMAMWAVLARRPRGGWIESHATWMTWSYVGLVAAAVSETATRILMPILAPRLGPGALAAFWTLVGVATLAVVLAGSRVIKRRLPAAIAATPDAMRRERRHLRRLDGGTSERGPREAAG
jgi:uncharacterized membrane protein